MTLQYTRVVIAAGWVLIACLVGLAVDVTSTGAWVVLAAFGLLPPLVMQLLWKDPQQTMAESIREGRR